MDFMIGKFPLKKVNFQIDETLINNRWVKIFKMKYDRSLLLTTKNEVLTVIEKLSQRDLLSSSKEMVDHLSEDLKALNAQINLFIKGYHQISVNMDIFKSLISVLSRNEIVLLMKIISMNYPVVARKVVLGRESEVVSFVTGYKKDDLNALIKGRNYASIRTRKLDDETCEFLTKISAKINYWKSTGSVDKNTLRYMRMMSNSIQMAFINSEITNPQRMKDIYNENRNSTKFYQTSHIYDLYRYHFVSVNNDFKTVEKLMFVYEDEELKQLETEESLEDKRIRIKKAQEFFDTIDTEINWADEMDDFEFF
jgi:hypothetical protein